MLDLTRLRPDPRDYPPGELVKELSILLTFTVAGWVDASTGALLPAIREHYNVNFVVVSMLFVGNLCGWLISAFLTSILVRRIGFGKTLSLAVTSSLIAPALFILRPPFGVLVVAMVFASTSNGMLEALANVYISARPRAHVRLGILNFLYGLGALLAPLASVPFVKGSEEGAEGAAAVPFNLFYATTMGLGGATLAAVTLSFKLRRQPHLEAAASPDVVKAGNEGDGDGASTKGAIPAENSPFHEEPASSPVASIKASPSPSPFKLLYRSRTIWLLSMFCLLYVGAEVSIGGWITSFLLSKGNAVASSTYIVSGYWGGIAVGRILLIPPTSLLGDATAVLVYLLASITLQALIWKVPDLIANAVCLALQGFFLGPIFPIMVHYLSGKKKDPAMLSVSISFIVSFGSAGSALFPLVIGLAAEGSGMGIEILAPIAVALLVAQMGVWAVMVCLVPLLQRRDQGKTGSL